MNTAHTPAIEKDTAEPWFTSVNCESIILTTSLSTIALVYSGHDPEVDAIAKVNAARIVACYNALRGIPDPATFVARAKRIEKLVAAYVRHHDKSIAEQMNPGTPLLHTDSAAALFAELRTVLAEGAKT